MRFALVGLAFAASTAAAQQVDSLTLRVHVADSASRPIGAADVAVMEGLSDVRASGQTDASGFRMLRLARPRGAVEIVARKIGFARASFFLTPSADSASVTITLHRQIQALDAMKVTAREDVKRRSYHIDADEIEHSSRLLLDGLDILTKLKPDILSGRAPGCGAKYIWVNGKWIFNAPENPIVAARRPLSPGRGMRNTQSGRPLPMPVMATAPNDVLNVMASIKPEHIEELNYVDCFDTSMPGVHGESALYVVLKPGIGFEPGIGSYVLDDKPKRAARAEQNTPASPAVISATYRNRLLGVFDAETGDPVPGASVIDSTSGTSALTTATGTVTLAFLPDGASTLRIVKPGFAETRLAVTISPRDTLPITIILNRP